MVVVKYCGSTAPSVFSIRTEGFWGEMVGPEIFKIARNKKSFLGNAFQLLFGGSSRSDTGVLWKTGLFKNVPFPAALEKLEILEILEIPQAVENKGALDHFLEILENLEIFRDLEITHPFILAPFSVPEKQEIVTVDTSEQRSKAMLRTYLKHSPHEMHLLISGVATVQLADPNGPKWASPGQNGPKWTILVHSGFAMLKSGSECSFQPLNSLRQDLPPILFRPQFRPWSQTML